MLGTKAVFHTMRDAFLQGETGKQLSQEMGVWERNTEQCYFTVH